MIAINERPVLDCADIRHGWHFVGQMLQIVPLVVSLLVVPIFLSCMGSANAKDAGTAEVTVETPVKSPVKTTASQAESQPAAGIACRLSWLGGGKPYDQYVVEISDDSRFGTSLLKTTVKELFLTWTAPKEGVFHWRLTPESRLQAAHGAEVSSLASGSFVAVHGQAPGLQPLTLQWTPDPDALAYFVVVTDAQGVSRRSVSFKPSFLLVRPASASFVEVLVRARGSNKNRVPDAVHHFDPGLTIGGQRTQEPLQREMIVGNEPIPAPEPPAMLPLPEPPRPVDLNAATIRTIEDPTIPEERISEVMLTLEVGRDRFYASQKSISRSAATATTGAGFLMRTVPVTWLHLFAEAHGHGAQVTWVKDDDTSYQSAQPVSVYVAEAGLGVDLFFRNPNRRHSLVLECRGGMGQIPVIPFESTLQNPAKFSNGDLKQEVFQVVGPGVSYRWTVRGYGIGLHASELIQATKRTEDNHARLRQWGGYVSWDPTKYVALRIGGTNRMVDLARCAETDSLCQTDGTSVAGLTWNSGYVGLGYVFY